MSDEKRDPVKVMRQTAYVTTVQAERCYHALRAAGLLRDEAEIAARERAAREKALREAAAVVDLEAQYYTGLHEGAILDRQAKAILALIDKETAP